MGHRASQKLVVLSVMSFCCSPVTLAAKSVTTLSGNVDVVTIRNEISSIERDLLQSQQNQAGAATQLKKIRKLMVLQKKEISLSRQKIKELAENLNTLSLQKTSLLQSIEKQKIELRARLRDLNRLTETDLLDASWLTTLDVDNQKNYFLAKSLRKKLIAVEGLKRDAQAALALELRIIEEKNKLDYYVQELEGQSSILSANEEVQREIIQSNRTNRLEAMRRMRSLKESELELEEMIAKFPSKSVPPQQNETIDVTLSALKGKLPSPVEGKVLTSFGKSFNPKTNLLMFQKGVTFSATPSSQVKAVFGGKVAYAGSLKNYGLIVILEHPGQYYTLYGQLGSVSVELGARVTQGDALGRTNGEPLYFEIRSQNVAINPLQWLGSGSITLSKQ